ncbi:hypothetical protein TNCT_307561 [Trichonephila clavata]|uniref:Uncharacterized protein n=1 Tax=Trichonephila clavata TaxID=2740835 RepID=A0A8X6FBS3_TRICU|nr:hypothetical protein TNCT_307561 [Trichonephila clavata]
MRPIMLRADTAHETQYYDHACADVRLNLSPNSKTGSRQVVILRVDITPQVKPGFIRNKEKIHVQVIHCYLSKQVYNAPFEIHQDDIFEEYICISVWISL